MGGNSLGGHVADDTVRGKCKWAFQAKGIGRETKAAAEGCGGCERVSWKMGAVRLRVQL